MMSTSNETSKVAEPSLIKDAINLALYYLWRASNRARPYLSGRRGLILLTIAVLGAGVVFNWSWLVAIGAAPLLLALAPCAIMCGLGLCMNKMMGGKSCSTTSSSCSTGSSTAEANADARLAATARHVERPGEPAVVVPDREAAALPDISISDGEVRTAVLNRNEAER